MWIFLFSFIGAAILMLMVNVNNKQEKEISQIKMEKQENETQKKKERFEEFCKLHPEIKSLSETVNRDINSLARQSILASSVNIRPTPQHIREGYIRALWVITYLYFQTLKKKHSTRVP